MLREEQPVETHGQPQEPLTESALEKAHISMQMARLKARLVQALPSDNMLTYSYLTPSKRAKLLQYAMVASFHILRLKWSTMTLAILSCSLMPML